MDFSSTVPHSASFLEAPLVSGPERPVRRPVSQDDQATSARIMMVDDELLNTKAVQTHLEIAGLTNFVKTTDDTQALKQILYEKPDVLLLDIVMPHVNGLDILQALRALNDFTAMPIIILTSIDDRKTKSFALELGATDFLTKPVDPTELVPRVRNAIAIKEHHDYLHRYAENLERQVLARTKELAASRLEVIHCLARAADYRDNETGRHVVRVGRYAGVVARGMNLDPQLVELIEHAAPLHDVGKIGIPDAILLKPARLTAEEMTVIQRHCQYGHEIIAGKNAGGFNYSAVAAATAPLSPAADPSPLLKMAAVIALTHHEKWDGTGYPNRLVGEQIPLPGRITAVADVFDALGTKRPYKDALSADQCFQILKQGRGSHFDPQVLDSVFAQQEKFLEIRRELADPE